MPPTSIYTSLIFIYVITSYSIHYTKLYEKGTLSIIIIFGLALAFLLFRYINIKEVYILVGGIILGLFLFYIFSRRFLSEKELP